MGARRVISTPDMIPDISIAPPIMPAFVAYSGATSLENNINLNHHTISLIIRCPTLRRPRKAMLSVLLWNDVSSFEFAEPNIQTNIGLVLAVS